VRVLTDAELALGIGERAATRVKESFGWDKVADTFASICEEAIGQETVTNLAAAKEGTQAAV